MECPDCKSSMVKARIQLEDLSGWISGWLCECTGDQEFEIYIWSKNNEQLPQHLQDGEDNPKD
jgi:hypothetical protein